MRRDPHACPMHEFDARAHSPHATECARGSNPIQRSTRGARQHHAGHGICSAPSTRRGGGGLDVMSWDRVKVPSIERCFSGVSYGRAQGFRVPFDRVASFIHHHPAAASTFETPQLVVYTFNISSTGRCLSSLDAASGWVVNVCNVALSRSSRTWHSLAHRADPAVIDRSQRLFGRVWRPTEGHHGPYRQPIGCPRGALS